MTWLSSRGTWPLWSSASPLWRPEFRPQLQALDAALAGVEPKAFAAALESETRARFDRLAAGIECLSPAPVPALAPGAAGPVAGRHHASARLSRRQRARRAGPARRAVAHQSGPYPRPHGRPQPAAGAGRRRARGRCSSTGARRASLERGFSLTDYIAGRLEQALDRVLAEVGGPVVLLGYCMGGLLALALGPAPAARPGRAGLPGDALGLPCRAAVAGQAARRQPEPGRAAAAQPRASCRSMPSRRSSPASIRCR